MKKTIIIIIIILLVFTSVLSAKPNKKNKLKINISSSLSGGEVGGMMQTVVISPEDSGAFEVLIKGEEYEQYTVEFIQHSVYIECKKTSDYVIVSDFTTSLDNNTGTLNYKGRDTFTVGATFENPGGEISGGFYEGQGLITVNYLN